MRRAEKVERAYRMLWTALQDPKFPRKGSCSHFGPDVHIGDKPNSGQYLQFCTDTPLSGPLLYVHINVGSVYTSDKAGNVLVNRMSRRTLLPLVATVRKASGKKVLRHELGPHYVTMAVEATPPESLKTGLANYRAFGSEVLNNDPDCDFMKSSTAWYDWLQRALRKADPEFYDRYVKGTD